MAARLGFIPYQYKSNIIKVKKSAGSNRQILGSNSIVMVHLEEIKDLRVLVADKDGSVSLAYYPFLGDASNTYAEVAAVAEGPN